MANARRISHTKMVLVAATLLGVFLGSNAWAGGIADSVITTDFYEFRGISCDNEFCGYSTVDAACSNLAPAYDHPSDVSYLGISVDLNRDAGGDYIYLCVVDVPYTPYFGGSQTRTSLGSMYVAGSTYIPEVCIGNQAEPDYCYDAYWVHELCHWPAFRTTMDAVYSKAFDLNEGTDDQRMRLCYRGKPDIMGDYVQIARVAVGASDSSAYDARERCINEVRYHEGWGLDVLAWTHVIHGDLNEGAGGDWIALCAYQPPRTALPVAASCPSNLVSFRANANRYIECYCSSAATQSGSVWGTDVYTDDSRLCRAALHAGVVTSAGGTIVAKIVEGESSYVGSYQNGVSTSSFPSRNG